MELKKGDRFLYKGINAEYTDLIGEIVGIGKHYGYEYILFDNDGHLLTCGKYLRLDSLELLK